MICLSAPKVRSQFFEIVKGFGMLPDKEIVDFALGGTSVHCLPSMIYHLEQKCDVGPFVPCLPSMQSSNLQNQIILNKYAR